MAQMKKVTFWVSFDRRYGTDVIVGYEVIYEGFSHHSDDEGYVHKRICDQGIHNNAHETSFEFQDGEYIIHLGASAGSSLDRVEFTTNLERHFKAGGNGGTYNKCITSDSHSHDEGHHSEHEHYHPRFISFNCAHGPLDLTAFGGNYILVPGSCGVCDISQKELDEENERLRLESEAKEREYIRIEEERKAAEAEAERLRLEQEAELER